MKLTWHNYRYYPYERQLGLREAAALLGPGRLKEIENGIELSGGIARDARRLVYFSQIHQGKIATDTIQARLESAVMAGRNRQSTRYSVHGLHEYKGKFNPQIAKAILNIFGVRPGDQVLDPFCGSGTTLVECTQMGARGIGFDINPFAVFVANAKLQALTTPVVVLREVLTKIATSLGRTSSWNAPIPHDERGLYLSSWFEADTLCIVETVRAHVESAAGEFAPIFLALASNQLRDYSLQDPNDLRIRRRKTPLPEKPFVTVFLEATQNFLERVAQAQMVLGTDLHRGGASLHNMTSAPPVTSSKPFDAALTSPPYAMALPYIDTQRLSLVWLDLIPADRLLGLEADLIGSREMRVAARRELALRILNNTDLLPEEQLTFCWTLQNSLAPSDGFRRKAVPTLLYRYFADMKASFQSVRACMKQGAPYGLIVGHNHTVLGGVRYDIDTPNHLVSIALSAGWKLEELIELQTYHRYGYHMGNAVSAETLILLRNQ